VPLLSFPLAAHSVAYNKYLPQTSGQMPASLRFHHRGHDHHCRHHRRRRYHHRQQWKFSAVNQWGISQFTYSIGRCPLLLLSAFRCAALELRATKAVHPLWAAGRRSSPVQASPFFLGANFSRPLI